MKTLVTIILLCLPFVVQSADITVHFEDRIVVARDCPPIPMYTWVEGQRHLGKVSVHGPCDTDEINHPGWMPDIPVSDMWVTLLFEDELHLNCAMMQTAFSGHQRLIISCREPGRSRWMRNE